MIIVATKQPAPRHLRQRTATLGDLPARERLLYQTGRDGFELTRLGDLVRSVRAGGSARGNLKRADFARVMAAAEAPERARLLRAAAAGTLKVTGR